jgi:hypothetical protein
MIKDIHSLAQLKSNSCLELKMFHIEVVTAQVNQTRVGVTRQLVSNPPQPQQTFRQLPDNLGSGFLVYNLILTQVDEICKKKYWGAIKKNIKIFRLLPDNLGS